MYGKGQLVIGNCMVKVVKCVSFRSVSGFLVSCFTTIRLVSPGTDKRVRHIGGWWGAVYTYIINSSTLPLFHKIASYYASHTHIHFKRL